MEQRLAALESKVDGLCDDLKGNCKDTAQVRSDTREILKLLRGPLDKPEEGLVAKVNRHEHTHRTVRRAMVAAVIGTLTAIGSTVGSWFHITPPK